MERLKEDDHGRGKPKVERLKEDEQFIDLRTT